MPLGKVTEPLVVMLPWLPNPREKSIDGNYQVLICWMAVSPPVLPVKPT